MVIDPDYGPRLSDAEYDRQIIALQVDLPPMPSRKQQRQARRQELDLAINHRLGMEFPKGRRDSLWRVKQRVERRRLLLLARYGIRRFIGRTAIPDGLVEDAHGIVGFMVDAFADVLEETELRRFFGLDSREKPALPVPLRRD